jgi:cytochrome c
MFARAISISVLTIMLASPALADGDPVKGEKLFARCKVCHTVGKDEPNRTGPNLYGLFDRKSGEAPGYKYSKALQEADFQWTEEKVYEWLQNPKTFLPGNKMIFAGIKDSQQRKDLIAYLVKATGKED